MHVLWPSQHFPFHKILSFLMVALICSACVENQGLRAKKGLKSKTQLTGNANGGLNVIPDDGTVDGASAVRTQRVELTHLVDPFDGTYKKKITIPKNFKGNLYLAGINVAALQDKFVQVRFNFGIDRQSVVLNATVGRAPGIIPKTDIQVLMVDFNSKPLRLLRLGYDLFDYNDYSNTTDDIKEPVTDPRNGNLYCRGLQLEDDPTFSLVSATCSNSDSKCLYTYAKITDATMYSDATGLTSIPTRPQIWTESSGVRTPSITSAVSTMCLPDSGDRISFNNLFGTALVGLAYNELVLGLRYRGSYRAINSAGWKITSDAIFSQTSDGLFYGLFKARNSALDPFTGFQSLLFPLSGKIPLSQGVNYFGSTDRFGPRTSLTADSTGTTQYVDGCNIRTSNFNPVASESISSCNVNSSIEIFYVKDGKEISVTIDKAIKLQLIKASLTDFEGKEVLASAFKRCESSSACGSNECCFNERCWSKDLVTQCVDQLPIIGNQQIGSNCATDYECSSLCCNSGTGTCAPHNPNGIAPAFCGKNSGQRCIAKEFCSPQVVAVCKIIKLPPLSDGTAQCTRRCTPVETYGACTSGFCVPPAIPPVPPFDPANCAGAVDP